MTATGSARGARLRGSDVVAVLAAQAVVIAALWIAHGGPDQLAEGPAGILTAIGQVTALYGTYLALIQLVLMSRSPWLDETFGMDGLAVAHRWLGFTTVWLLLGHGIATTVGYALGDGVNVVQEFVTLITTYPYVLMATVSGGLFALVAITSIKAARRRLAYETWYGLHLYAYLAIALGFLHQLFVGADFMHDQVAAIYWILLYVATVALILAFRIGQPIRTSLRHRLRVANVVPEAPGVVSLYLTGRDLDRLAVRAGQYFLWRFLTPDGWWRSHPYSISAAPNGDWLRITVKDLGDGSRDLTRVPIGTRVMVEGPYGILTDVKRTKPGVLLIAGGIGITPLRALLEGAAGASRRHHPALPGPPPAGRHLPRRARGPGAPAGDRGPLPDRAARITRAAARSARRTRDRDARARRARARRLRLRTGVDDAVHGGGAAHARRAAPAGPCRTVRVLAP